MSVDPWFVVLNLIGQTVLVCQRCRVVHMPPPDGPYPEQCGGCGLVSFTLG